MYFMKKLLFPLSFAFVFFTAPSCTDHEIDGMLSRTDQDFMIKAADSNLFEVMAGEMASGKAVIDSVRHYGAHMVTDHSKATAEMMSLAQKKMLDLPETLSMDKQKKLDSLAMMSGMAFDSLYMTMMVKSHVETIDLFHTETTLGNDPEVKSFAAGKLPTLNHHLEEAIALKERFW
jgi:putative membrane protein